MPELPDITVYLEALEALSFFNAEYLHLDYDVNKPRAVEREGA